MMEVLESSDSSALNTTDASNFIVHQSIQKDLIEFKEPEKKYTCHYTDCKATFLRPSRLQRHLRLHSGERPYKCNVPECTKAYTNSSHLKRHMESHNSIKRGYQCNKCSLTISNFHNLKRHYARVHNNTKMTCTECNESFSKKYQLTKHMAIHFGFKCNECSKAFTTSKLLKLHEGIHKEKKQYHCSECPEIFNKWALFCEHRKTHVKVLEYKCTHCDKVFVRKNGLRSHLKTHAENRPSVSCPYENCTKKYFFQYNLDQHIRSYHNGEKFFCDMCSAGLSTKQKLIEHIGNIHESPKKVRKPKKYPRKKRKDAGIIRKSIVTALVGLNLPQKVEKEIMEMRTEIPV